MKIKNFFYVLMILISGCCTKGETALDVSKQNSQDKLRSVLINKTQCDLIGDFKNTAIEDLQGVWEDTLIWKTQSKEGCYFGFEELDRHITLNISSSKTYTWKEKFTIAERDFEEYGEFFLTNENNFTSLLLAENGKRDSISAHGDTLSAISYRLFWTDSTSMFLLPRNPIDGDYKTHEVIEFYKVD